MEDLRNVVQEFTEKQSLFLSGGENIVSQIPTSNEIVEEHNHEQDIKKEPNDVQNQEKETLNNNQNKINPVIYGIISPESLPCKKVETKEYDNRRW